MMQQHFLVPIDFSSHADKALDAAIFLAQKLKAHIDLIHVRDDSNLNLLRYTAEAEAKTREALKQYLERVREAGLEGDTTLVHGTPWQEIVEMAKEKKISLIIMGSRGRTGLAHLLLGSVTEKVVHVAPCPVMVTHT